MIASPHDRSAIERVRRPSASATMNTALKAISIEATMTTDRNVSSARSSNARPIMAAGIVPSTINQASLLSESTRERVRSEPRPARSSTIQRVLKNHSTDKSVPRCSAASNVRPYWS